MPLSTFPTLDRPSNIAAVDGCPLFTLLAPTDRAAIANHSFMAHAERDETIWTEGSPSSFIAVIASGRVRLTRKDSSGHEIDLAALNSGRCFGMEAVCGRSDHASNAVAAEHTWYLKVPARVVLTLLCPDTPGGSPSR